MKIAVQMFALDNAIPGYDNSLLLIQEGNKRGYDVYQYCPEDISLNERGDLTARARKAYVDLTKPKDQAIRTDQDETINLEDMDVIFFRQDPPFDMAYITNTYLLERLEGKVALVNNPRWIRDMPDKLSIFDYPEFLPPTLISRDLNQIEAFFSAQNNDVVAKPLYGFKGHGIKRLSSATEASDMLEQTNEPIMFQPFLKEIKDGNIRIVLFDGDIIGALKSIPSEDFRVYHDSIDTAYEPTDHDRKLCEKLKPVLQERGLRFVGIDLIGPYLTEINVGSVGSLVRLNEVYNDCYEAKLFDVIEASLNS